MTRDLAPIALFVYRRPEHLDLVLSALEQNEFAAESDLLIFSEAATGDDDREGVERVRARLATVSGFRSVEIHARPAHLGLAASITDGVSFTISRYGRAIVLEDDLVTSPHFLRFMNDALAVYADVEEVISVSGTCLSVLGRLPETYFRRDADCYGWGTWARGWRLYEPDGASLLDRLEARGLQRSFDLHGAYPYTELLRRQARGEIDSWAIRWQAAARLAGKFTLYPGRALVANIGFDGTGTHPAAIPWFAARRGLSSRPIRVERLDVVERRRVARLHRGFYRDLAEAAGLRSSRRWSPRRLYRGLRRRLRAA